MKLVIQRVLNASVDVEGKSIASIGNGVLVFIGIKEGDTILEIDYMIDKLINLRIFEGDGKQMEKSILDIKGQLLIVSQFTLYANCNKGRRPSFLNALNPSSAESLYKIFVEKLREAVNRDTTMGGLVATGQFGANMQVSLLNDGPVTIILEK